MNYRQACIDLGFDPERPQWPGMDLTETFKSWQVTGIRRFIEIYQQLPSCRMETLDRKLHLDRIEEHYLALLIHSWWSRQ